MRWVRGPGGGGIVRVSFLALLLATPASGLDPLTALTQYGHTAWRIRDGYLAGQPGSIAQTTDGFLWIGTNTGLVRFDGVKFTPWEPPAGSPLPDPRIINVLGTSDGSLWIGTANGLARWHGGRLTVQARAGRFGALIEDRQGTVWAGHTRALQEVPPLCRFRQGEFRCFKFPGERRLDYVGVLHEDRRGQLWIGGPAGVCRWRPQGPACYDIGALAGLGDRSGVFFLADDVEGHLWAATLGQGFWRLAGNRWTAEPGLDSGPLLADRDGSLWLGTGEGLVRRAKGRTEHFSPADGLSGDEINTIFEDREGNVWVVTSSGLDRFRDVKVATLTSREGLPEVRINAVAASRDGSVWIAERGALLRWREGGISEYGEAQGLPGSTTTSLLEDSRGRLWVGVDNGLAWWERGRFSSFDMPDGSPVGVVRAIVEDRDGSLWVTTTRAEHALLHLRGERLVETVPAERTGGAQISAIAAHPQGGVWLGPIDSELKIYRNGRFETAGKLGGPDRRKLYGLLPGRHGLWLITSRGLGLLRNGASSTLDTDHGLPCDEIEDAVAGEDGSLWLKTVCGLVRIPAGELDAWSTHPERRVRVRVLDAFDGVRVGLSPFTPRSTKSLDGRLWFAIEGGGLQVLDPGRMKDNAVPPPVRILGVVADHRVYDPDSPLRLPPLTRDLEIAFTALSLTIPEKVRFRYQLLGAGDGWHDAGTRREAFFTNLKPGSYRFNVIACNNDGVWSPAPATLAFAVLPAFYQTRGFLLLCLAASAFLAWTGYRWHIHQIAARLDLQFQERLAERTRIAQDLHDTLLQGFLSASMQLHVVVDGLPAGAPEKPRLSRVLRLMAAVIEEGRNAMRGLRAPAPRTSGADDLAQALMRVSQELGFPEAAGLRVIVEGPSRLLHPPIHDEVYRISREALVNAFQHAEASEIEIEIEFAARTLRVLVRDNGRGIDPEVLRAGREGHWGLSGIRERAEAIGARLRVWSRERAGTEIELSVPGRIAFRDLPSTGLLGWWRRRMSGSGRDP